MKKFLLEHNDYLTQSMIDYIIKTKLVFNKKYKKFNLYGYSCKENTNYLLCARRINKLYTDIYKDFKIKIKHLNIVLIDCPDHRQFIDHPHYVNGGFTYINNNIIYVYRHDEMLKVILHEVIHHAFYFKDSDVYLGDPIRSKVNINFNEAIVEFLATLYQIKYASSTIQNELKHSLKNVKNVISLCPYNTNLYSYIVIKHLLLKKSKFVLKCIQNGKYDLIYQYIHKIKINKISNYKQLKELIFVNG